MEIAASLPAAGVAERPARRVVVHSEADIRAAVRQAYECGARVRAVGSRGSKSPNFHTSGVALSLGRYDRLLSVRDNLVTVEAGMTLARLNAVLRRHDLALPTLGEWGGATVAGAIATGTHGGSCRHGNLATSVRALRLVTGTGDVLDLAPGDPLFQHAGVSLGLLGVTSTLTFEGVARFYVALEQRAVALERFAGELDRYVREPEFASAVWVPTAGCVIAFTGNRAPRPARTVRRDPRFSVRTYLLSVLSRRLGVNGLFTDRLFHTTAIDESDRILCPLGTPPWVVRAQRVVSRLSQREVECAIPLDRAAEALMRLDGLLAEHPHALVNPVGLRPTARDRYSLSPCSERDTFWIALFCHDDERFMAAVRELFEDLEARCHWGKRVILPAARLAARYPRWDAFGAARAELDPRRVFANRFVEGLGL